MQKAVQDDQASRFRMKLTFAIFRGQLRYRPKGLVPHDPRRVDRTGQPAKLVSGCNRHPRLVFAGGVGDQGDHGGARRFDRANGGRRVSPWAEGDERPVSTNVARTWREMKDARSSPTFPWPPVMR